MENLKSAFFSVMLTFGALLTMSPTQVVAGYSAHYLCFGGGAGINFRDYHLASMELATCHKLGWFSVDRNPSLKVFVNVNRSSANYLAQYVSLKLGTFLLAYSTDARYVEVKGRYYGKVLHLSPPSLPFAVNLFEVGQYERLSEESDGSTTSHRLVIQGMGTGIDAPIFWRDAAIEVDDL